MGLMRNLVDGARAMVQKPRVERELEEELDGFVEASAEEKQRSGMEWGEALRAARVEMGSRGAVKHQVWSSRWEGGLDGVLQDVRISVRMLLKTPGFTLVALLSLALGIGANTAIFTLIHQVMLRNLPVHDPGQLVTFGESEGGGVLGGVDLGFFGMFPWHFAREMQANPGPFHRGGERDDDDGGVAAGAAGVASGSDGGAAVRLNFRVSQGRWVYSGGYSIEP